MSSLDSAYEALRTQLKDLGQSSEFFSYAITQIGKLVDSFKSSGATQTFLADVRSQCNEMADEQIEEYCRVSENAARLSKLRGNIEAEPPLADRETVEYLMNTFRQYTDVICEALRGQSRIDEEQISWVKEEMAGSNQRIQRKLYDAHTRFLTLLAETESNGLPSPPVSNENFTVDSAHRAHLPKIFPKGLPADPDIRDLALKLNAERGAQKSANQIAREFTGEQQDGFPEAKRLLSRLRKMKLEGKYVP